MSAAFPLHVAYANSTDYRVQMDFSIQREQQ